MEVYYEVPKFLLLYAQTQLPASGLTFTMLKVM